MTFLLAAVAAVLGLVGWIELRDDPGQPAELRQFAPRGAALGAAVLILFGTGMAAAGLFPEEFGLPPRSSVPLWLFLVPLGLAVLGWGGFLLHAALAWREARATPWLAWRSWRNNRIPAATEPVFVEIWLLAVYVFGALAWITGQPRMAAVGLAIAIAPAGWWAVDRLRFGFTEITLTPPPGRIGGTVAGFARVRGLPRGEPVSVTLACTQLSWSFGGRARRRSVMLWSDVITSPVGEDGTVAFRFEPPAGLPGSQPPSSCFIRWRLRLRTEALAFGLDHWHTLPVFSLG